MSEVVQSEIRDHVAVVTIDRPNTLNALDMETLKALDEAFAAAEAQALGLLNRVVPDHSLMSEAHALAQTIVGKSPLVLKLLKRAVTDGAEMPLSAALRHEQAMISLVFDSADAHEGMSAFLEKRQPKFRGA